MRGVREWTVADAVLGATLGALALLEIWTPRLVPGVGEVTGNRPFLAATSLVATAALAVRRSRPVATMLVVAVMMALQQVVTTPTEGLALLLSALIAAYSSSAYSSVTRAATAGGVIVLGAAFMGTDASDWAFITVVLGGAWLVGFVVMQRSADLVRVRQDNIELSARLANAVDQLVRVQAEQSTAHDVTGLSSREVEVARAIARGLTNAEIAGELFISEWTVKTHVASILRKLGLRDRAQVVIAAYESGLVAPGDRGR